MKQSLYRKGRRWISTVTGNSPRNQGQGTTASTMESENVHQADQIQEEHSSPPGGAAPPPNYEPSAELVAKLHALSKDVAVTDATVRLKVKQALDTAPAISVRYPIPQEMRGRAIEFRGYIDSIDTFLDESLERLEDVLLFRSEVVRLQRVLCFGARPGSESHSDLARFIRYLTLALSKNEQTEEACVLDEEAIAIRRECYLIRPDAERPHLAKMLHSYSGHLHSEERYKEALTAAEESVKLRRVLFEIDPDESMENLAVSLRDLGIRLSSVQRFDDAKTTEEEGLVLWRLLYKKKPSKYRSMLVKALSNYIVSLKDLGLASEVKAARAERDELKAKIA